MDKLVLICLACASHGRRVHTSLKAAHSASNSDHSIPASLGSHANRPGQLAPPTHLYSILHNLAEVKAAHAFKGASPKSSTGELASSSLPLQLQLAVIQWTVPLFVIWSILRAVLGKIAWFAEKPGASAHAVVNIVPMVHFALKGSKMWLLDKDFAGRSTHDKVWGVYPEIVSMLTSMFAFQVWDFFASVICPPLRKAPHVIHHSCTAAMALVSLMNGPHGFLQYYAPFFVGISEVSSILLAPMMLFRMNEDFAANFEGINQFCRVLFAVLFLSIRCLYWPFVVLDVWKSVLSNHVPKALSSTTVGSSIFFTFLQFYWGWQIVTEAIKTL